MTLLRIPPYPGNGTGFVTQGSWNEFNQGDDCTLCRQMSFVAVERNAFITEIDLRGYKDGRVILTIFTQTTKDAIKLFKRFISDCGLTEDAARLAGKNSYMATSSREIEHLIKILHNNNGISARQLASIRRVLKTASLIDL